MPASRGHPLKSGLQSERTGERVFSDRVICSSIDACHTGRILEIPTRRRHMALDPQVTELGVQLADLGVRNTVAAVSGRIKTAKAKKQDAETINVLTEIVNDLLADRNDLVRIARGYEQVLDAQRISEEEITYIAESIVPIIHKLAEAGGNDVDQVIDLVKPILSVETVTVLQLLGFNFKKAIGEPLTALVAQLIGSRTPASPDAAAQAQRLSLELQIASASLAQDEEAYDRFKSLWS